MEDTKKILKDAIASVKADDAVGLKNHISNALLTKIRQAVKSKKKELSRKLFRNKKV